MAKLIAKYASLSKKISDSFGLYYSHDWANIPASLKTNTKKPATIKIVGRNLPHTPDWNYQFEGEWIEHMKYGLEFKAVSCVQLKPDGKKGIEKYLCSSLFKGVGKKKAKDIVEMFGLDTLKVIEENPKQLMAVRGITEELAGRISEIHKENAVLSELSVYLNKYGIGLNLANTIYNTYGKEALNTLKKDPFILATVRGVGFKTCDRIARDEGVKLDSYERIAGAIKFTLDRYCEATKDIGEEIRQLENEAMALINDTGVYVDHAKYFEVLKDLRQKDEIRCRLGKYILLKKYDEYEENIAKHIAFTKSETPFKKEDIEKALEKTQESLPFKMADEQVNAIVNSLMSPVSVITGYAGTGKSTIMKAIIDIYEQLRPLEDIVLMAPTGKAARRMEETTGRRASTIHRALGLYEGYNGEVNSWFKGLIIIDETSMIDVYVMDKVMTACCNPKSNLIFLGDTNQLPSVGIGCVLQSMIESGEVPVSRLTQVFRQKGGSIFDNCHKIIQGQTDLIFDENFEYVNAGNEEDAIKKVKNLYVEECKKYGIENVALLTPLRAMNNGKLCVADNLNRIIQDTVNPYSSGSCTLNKTEYRINDRVMQWKNREFTSNGDIGTIENIIIGDDGIEVTVKWENGETTKETQETMNDIKLAYSYSVHKSQGSEYKSVITCILSSQKMIPILNRNLIYTDISRCKEHMIVIGDEEAIKDCINNVDSTKRFSLISERVKHYKQKALEA